MHTGDRSYRQPPTPDEIHPMLTVTHAARELLSEMMAELQPTAGKVVRIVTSGAGLSLELGEIQADDRVFKHDTRLVLAVAEDVARDRERLTLDAVVTARGLDLRVAADSDPLQSDSFLPRRLELSGSAGWPTFPATARHERGPNQLRLQQPQATLMVSANAWRNLVETARIKGWPSEHPTACYWGDVGLTVSDRDARRLARVFEAMGDHLAHHQQERPEEAEELIGTLGELVLFCRAGGFRVC